MVSEKGRKWKKEGEGRQPGTVMEKGGGLFKKSTVKCIRCRALEIDQQNIVFGSYNRLVNEATKL